MVLISIYLILYSWEYLKASSFNKSKFTFPAVDHSEITAANLKIICESIFWNEDDNPIYPDNIQQFLT